MGLDAEIHRISRKVRQLSAGRVLAAKIVGKHIEAEVELVPGGERVWCEMCGGLGGGGFFGRVPGEGDVAIVGLVGGDVTDGYVLNWFDTDEATPIPDFVEAGSSYVVPPPGEPLVVRVSDGATIRIEGDGVEVLERLSSTLGDLSKALEALSTATTSTQLGPQPLLNAATYATLKASVEKIKADVDTLRG